MRALEFLQSDTGQDRADPFLGMPADNDEAEQPVPITPDSGSQSASKFLKGIKEPPGVKNNSAPQFLRSPAEEGSGEPSLLRKADIALGKIIHPALYYSGMEGLGRLWDLPANVGYGMWEGGKKALKGDVKDGLKEPVKAAVKTMSGEGYSM